MRPLAAVIVATFVVAVGASVAAQDAKPAFRDLTNKTGTETLVVPGDWSVEDAEPGPDAVARWRIGLPKAAERLDVSVALLEGERDELLAASAVAMEHRGYVRHKPMPHVVVVQDGTPSLFVVPRVVRRRGFALAMSGPKAAAEKALPAFLAAAAKFTSTRGEYPTVPDSFARSTRDGYVYLVHASAKGLDIGPLHKQVLAQETAFKKRYGDVPKSAANPVMVAVVADAADAKALDAEFEAPAHARRREGLLVAVLPLADDAVTRGRVAEAVATLFHVQLFGGIAPRWLAEGDAALAKFEAESGVELPTVAESKAHDLPTSLRRLDEIGGPRAATGPVGVDAMAYLAYFRSFPRDPRDASFEKFKWFTIGLRSAADDPRTVEMSIFGLINHDALRASVREFLKTAKVVKGR